MRQCASPALFCWILERLQTHKRHNYPNIRIMNRYGSSSTGTQRGEKRFKLQGETRVVVSCGFGRSSSEVEDPITRWAQGGWGDAEPDKSGAQTPGSGLEMLPPQSNPLKPEPSPELPPLCATDTRCPRRSALITPGSRSNGAFIAHNRRG